ncbi:MAG: monofunctional biosynthetic peptidoglycan transglycosylase [Deltaproteobacteria bacterium HGW-Deltaproteobacteria-13]|jgi:monofunctional biosynthetic peptidoglycan transglycosylase|nr:MAG: monofunctional biosynthetic peptidoglycan transglycosylase [Deltaproteobacteria bacterium HGW-Deltaproteobacteria-13]
MRSFGRIISIILILVLTYFIIDVGRYFVYPNVSDLKKNCPRKTAFMEYREKVWKEKGIKRKITNIWVPLSSVSPYVMKAVIIAEDDKFWSHEGFDFDAMQKALEKDIKKKKFKAGGSTISQQLAKNLYLSPSKNPIRKLKEAILTWRLENNLSKRRIMELYLNVAEWGDGIYGIEAAARKHYGKSAAGLSAREAAELAAVIPNPRRYKTDGTSRYVEHQSERIYQIMVRRGIVIPEYDEMISEKDENNMGGPTDQTNVNLIEITGQKTEIKQEEQNKNSAPPDLGNKINP